MKSLFDFAAPLARPADPATSHEAADAIRPVLGRLHEWTVRCVTETPGRTQRELGARYCPDDPRRIGRRLAECERLGLLRRGAVRKCSVSGRNAETWWPNTADREVVMQGQPGDGASDSQPRSAKQQPRMVKASCPECGPVVVNADTFQSGRAISGLCPECGDRVYFG